jgi:hypothetical protein
MCCKVILITATELIILCFIRFIYASNRLRATGALIIGKANMHEIGIGTTGFNPHYGPARNAYNTSYYTGGSSSGSATSVAAGLGPVAVAADGGGAYFFTKSYAYLSTLIASAH